jgi:hypothetical protein
MHVPEQIETHQAINAVAVGKSRDASVPMLPETRDKVRRHTDVECPQTLTGQDVNARLLHWRG